MTRPSVRLFPLRQNAPVHKRGDECSGVPVGAVPGATETRNGAIYAFRTSNGCILYIMSTEESVNIDSEPDFWLAEWLIS